jgi:hypothetical protein
VWHRPPSSDSPPRLLPTPPAAPGAAAAGHGLEQGHGIDRTASTWTEKVRRLRSGLNDRAAHRYTSQIPGPPAGA